MQSTGGIREEEKGLFPEVPSLLVWSGLIYAVGSNSSPSGQNTIHHLNVQPVTSSIGDITNCERLKVQAAIIYPAQVTVGEGTFSEGVVHDE